MNSIPGFASLPQKSPDDDERSSSSDGTVEEPTETEQRYAALRNHQIRFADAIDPNAERVHKLRKKDIIFGRGRGFQNHPGNERMRDIIEKYKTQYHSLNRDGKRKLVEAVHAEITEGGARFLKKLDNEQAWVVVDLPIALQKVSHTMRCRKSIIRQLDEHGNIPGALSTPHLAANLPGMTPLAPMPMSGHLPGMGAIAGMSGFSDPAAGILGGPGAGLPSLGAHGMYAPPGAGAAAAAGDAPLAALEAQRMAALHRYRVLSGMAVARQGDIEYYQHLRREQLLRETRMLQQMGDVALLGGGSPPPTAAGSIVAPSAPTSSLAAVTATAGPSSSSALGVSNAPAAAAGRHIAPPPGARLQPSTLPASASSNLSESSASDIFADAVKDPSAHAE
ncbi:unnamed protein product [Cylindrotheca closterium]|uniref:DUF6824 domain-containing protein n=1 Tax=Cylindrotheca closterium TaxID=2856 RepID=A0AAD2JH82_9STRA|nr:unnamed protein product [Cylindrotheca closterium]